MDHQLVLVAAAIINTVFIVRHQIVEERRAKREDEWKNKVASVDAQLVKLHQYYAKQEQRMFPEFFDTSMRDQYKNDSDPIG